MDIEQERARFEVWARPDSVQMRRNPETGEYTERGMSAAWAGWQAAVKVEREACAEVCRKRARAMRETIRTANPRTSEHIMLRRDAREDEARECATAIMERSNAALTRRP